MTVYVNTLALQFCNASIKDPNEEMLRKLTADNFKCFAHWNCGSQISWNNIEQMIGGLKMEPWTAAIKDANVNDTGYARVETTHIEGPNRKKVHTVWRFTFAQNESGENKIESLDILTKL